MLSAKFRSLPLLVVIKKAVFIIDTHSKNELVNEGNKLVRRCPPV